MSKFIKLTEIYKKDSIARFSNTASTDDSSEYCLREVMVNPNYISMFWECAYFKDQLIEENKWPEGLDSRQNFTKLQIDSNGNSTKSTFYVVGPIELITKKLAQGD